MSPPDLPFERSHPYDVGVLLVHGIGEQRKGDTLLAAGSALVDVVQHRLDRLTATSKRSRATPSVRMQTQLHRDEPGEPARAVIELTDLDALRLPDGSSRRWLVAESWWAETFPQPSALQVFRWMVDILPATLVSHFDRRLRRAMFEIRNPDNLASPVGKYLRLLRDGVSLLAALVLVPPLLCALLVLLLVGFLPVPFVDSLARAVQRVLATTLGDSFALLGNPMTRSVIVDTVRRDLRWLDARCERVMIVAHSQGGAIAHEVVQADPLAPCRRLFTYGSGLQKLSLIEQMQAPGQSIRLWVAVISLFAASTMAAMAIGWIPVAAPLAAVASVGVATFSLAMAALFAWLRAGERYFTPDAQQEADRKLFGRRFKLANNRVQWSDVYASDDPVPNGPLLDEYRPREFDTSVTRNLGSILLDHTTYWDNRDDFVSRIARIVLTLSGIDVREIDRDDQDRQDAVSARRRWRVAWRRAGTWTALATSVLVAWQVWIAPPPLAARAYAWVHGLAADVPWVGTWLAPAGAAPFHSPLGVAIFVSATIVLIGLVVHLAWEVWNGNEMELALEHKPCSNQSRTFLIYAATLAGLGIAAIQYRFGVRVAAALMLSALVAAALVWIAGTFGWSAALENLRRRAATGSLDEIRARWRQRFESALERNAKRKHRWSVLEMGLRQIRSATKEDRERGVAALRQAIELGLPEAARALGDYFKDEQDLPAACAAYAEGQRLKDGWSTYLLGSLQLEMGNKVDGLATVQAAIDLGEPLATHTLGLAFRKNGKCAAARRAFAQGASFGDGLSIVWLADLWRDRAQAQEERKRMRSAQLAYRAAVRYYRRAIDAGEEDGAASLGSLLEARGDLQGAIAAYENGVRLGSGSAALALGRLLAEERRPDDAVRMLRRAMELSMVRETDRTLFGAVFGVLPMSVYSDAACELGQLAETRGELLSARRLYRLSLDTSERRGSGGEAARRLGRLLTEAGEPDAAEAVYREGLALGSARCGLALGSVLHHRGNDGAAAAYAAAIACIDADRSLDYREHGAVHEAHGDFLRETFKANEAMAAYEAAILKWWSSAERKLVDLIIDRRDVEKACAAAPKLWRSPEAALRLARYLVEEGRPDCAVQCVPYANDSLGLQLEAAAVLEQLRHYDQATWRYQEAMRRGSAVASARLINLLRYTGKFEEADEAERDARRRGLSPLPLSPL